MDRADLIAALEKAEGPSRKLDALIHQSVAPALADAIPDDDGWLVGGNHAQPTKAPAYTASLDAALTLVPEGMVWTVFTCDPPETDALFGALVGQRPSYGPLSMNRYRGSAATPALALCIAALRAALPIDTERPLTDEDRAAIANDPFAALKARE